MSEHTPETLRKLFKHSVSDGLTLAELEIALELHAAAWGADIAQREALETLVDDALMFWGDDNPAASDELYSVMQRLVALREAQHE